MLAAAVDPGKTCGYVLASVDFPVEMPRNLDAVAGQLDISSLLEELGSAEGLGLVVAERFSPIPGRAKSLAGQRLYASEALGALRQWCLDRGIPLIEQQPACIKTVKRSLLEAFGLWSVTSDLPHARDAARHLVAFILKNRGGLCDGLFERRPARENHG